MPIVVVQSEFVYQPTNSYPDEGVALIVTDVPGYTETELAPFTVAEPPVPDGSTLKVYLRLGSNSTSVLFALKRYVLPIVPTRPS